MTPRLGVVDTSGHRREEPVETIGMIGAGDMGSEIARAAIARGYRIVIANSRGPETLRALVNELGPSARAAHPAEAAAVGDFAILSFPLKVAHDLPVDELVGKVVLDTNKSRSSAPAARSAPRASSSRWARRRSGPGPARAAGPRLGLPDPAPVPAGRRRARRRAARPGRPASSDRDAHRRRAKCVPRAGRPLRAQGARAAGAADRAAARAAGRGTQHR